MLKPRWRKILGDLTVSKSRTFFVLIAMFIGIFGISVVANSYSILLREMDKNYMKTNPASATIWIGTSITEKELQKIRALPYLQDAQIRDKVVGRVQVGESDWKDIWLFVVQDFSNMRLNTFFPEGQKTLPKNGEILFERKALKLANSAVGKPINIKIANGEITSLDLVGSVHDPGLAPSWMEGYAYGYITKETLRTLGQEPSNSELKILVKDNQLNKDEITKTTNLLLSQLKQDGYNILRTEIPRPGKHIHYDQMATLLYLMEMFGILALILSAVLVANLVTGILEKQLRQLGIMKVVGASSSSLMRLYEGMIALLAFAGMLFSIPAGIYVGGIYANIAASILNFTIYSSEIPMYVFATEIGIGFLVPMLSAAYPIFKASRIPVRKALTDYGISQEKYSGKKESSFGFLNKLFSPPLLLSFRNTFRKKGRLLFTILVMSIGGTGFIAAMNIYASMYYTVDEKVASIAYDVQVTFDQPHPKQELTQAFEKIKDIENVEFWAGANVSRVNQDGTFGNNFRLVAPPATTKMLSQPPLFAGRWLTKEDTNSIVINQRVLSEEPDIKVGNMLNLIINGKETQWTVIGVSKEMLGFPTAYCNEEYLSTLLNMTNLATNAVVVTTDHNASLQVGVAKQIESIMPTLKLPIASLIKIEDTRVAIKNHLTIIASFLIIMSLLVVLVGGLGLATTVSINTVERTKEIGIMRSLGAKPSTVTGIIVSEGIVIGILSWVISLLLSFPISQYISYEFGMIFFDAPLEFAVSNSGYLIWLAIVIVFAALASYYPSKKATTMSLRDALSYE